MKKIGSLIVVLLISLTSLAQFTAQGPSVVGVGEGFTISFELKAYDAKHFEGPNISGARIISGPYTSQSSTTTYINGNRSSSRSYKWTYTLQAQKQGTVKISPARVKSGDKYYTSNSLTIEVTNNPSYSQRKGSSNQSHSNNPYNSNRQSYSPNISQQQSSQKEIKIDDKAIFVRAIPNKTNVVKGEEVIITYKLYTILPVTEYTIEKIPSSSGFWIEELDKQSNPTLTKEFLNGQQYQVANLKKVILYPQNTGTLTIKPMSISVVAQIPMRTTKRFTTGDPFFDQFFNDPMFASFGTSYQRVTKQMRTNSLTFDVKQLPKQPDDYCGGVGHDFKLSSSISSQNVKAFDAFYLTYTLTGEGNLTLINALPLDIPDEFQIFDPEIIDNIDRTEGGLKGSRTFRYLIIPTVEGKFDIPDLKISYYDVLSNSYQSLQTEGYSMQIAKAETSSSFAKQLDDRAKYRNMDITQQHSLKAKAKAYHIFDSVWMIVIPLLLVMALVVVVIIFSKYKKITSDVEAMRLKRATKVATKRLKKAKKLLDNKQMIAFEDETSNALWNYLLDRFKIDKTKLSIKACEDTLLAIGVREDTTKKLSQTLDRCGYLRFSQDKTAEADMSLYEDALNVITSIETQMKNLKKIKPQINIEQDEHKVNIPGAFTILFAILMIAQINLSAQSVDTIKHKNTVNKPYTYSQANHYYDTKQYDSALVAYTFLASKQPSASAYSSLAATYFRKSDYANAILYYEKALKLKPNDKTIQQNIKITRSRLVGDTYIMPDFLLFVWAKKLSGIFSILTWAVLFFVFFILCLVTVFIYLFSQRHKVLTFYLSISFLLISIFCAALGIQRQRIQDDNSYAIMMKSNIRMRQNPNSSAKEIHILYKGQKIKIEDKENSSWLKIKTEDNKEGYIEDKYYTRI